MFTYLNNGPYEELQYRLHKIFGGAVVHTASIPTNIALCVVSRCFRLYKVQDVLVYMPPTITYIYGLKKQLFVLISSTTTKFVNVA